MPLSSAFPQRPVRRAPSGSYLSEKDDGSSGQNSRARHSRRECLNDWTLMLTLIVEEYPGQDSGFDDMKATINVVDRHTHYRIVRSSMAVGRITVNAEPRPGSLATVISPPMARA